jgi:hypothetical protein
MSNNGFSRFGTSNMVLPKEGPNVFPFQVDFRAISQVEIDMQIPIDQGFISYIQGYFVDNSLNLNYLNITSSLVGQRISIPPKFMAYMPHFITDTPKLTLQTQQAGNLIVPFFITNVPVTPYMWQAIA